jgi:hypothetical protein
VIPGHDFATGLAAQHLIEGLLDPTLTMVVAHPAYDAARQVPMGAVALKLTLEPQATDAASAVGDTGSVESRNDAPLPIGGRKRASPPCRDSEIVHEQGAGFVQVRHLAWREGHPVPLTRHRKRRSVAVE